MEQIQNTEISEREIPENLEVRKEDTDRLVNVLEQARAKLNTKRELTEFDLPMEIREEWVKQNSKFLNEQIEIFYTQQEEITSSINFYLFDTDREGDIAVDNLIDNEIEDLKFQRKGIGINLDEMERNKGFVNDVPIVANKEDREATAEAIKDNPEEMGYRIEE